MRNFSSKQPKRDDYESGFDDLLKQGNVSESQKKAAEDAVKAKQAESEKMSQEQQKMREKDFAQKEQAFDDFLEGKQPQSKGITDDMSLQDIFKSFYGKAKNVDLGTETIKNSARSSLNSFSSRLEKRRQAAKEAQQKNEEKPAEEQPKEETAQKSEAKEET
jgi:hypothetical protein